MASKGKGNLYIIDDSEEEPPFKFSDPNDHEATNQTTQSVVKRQTDASAITDQYTAASSPALLPAMYTPSDNVCSVSSNDSQQLMTHTSLPQREFFGLPTSSDIPENEHRGTGIPPPRSRTTFFRFKVEQTMPAANAMMLKFKGFDQCNGSSTVDITFEDRNGHVTIKTRYEEELIQIQIKMHECVEQVMTRNRVIEKKLAEFLDTSPCRKYLSEKLSDTQIEAVIESDTQSCEVVTYAFTQEILDNAFKVLDETLIERELLLQPNELDAVTLTVDKVNQTTTQLSRIFLSSRAVNIYSLDAKEEDAIQRTIRNVKKEIKPKDVSATASVELSHARARCFNQHFSSDLASAIIKRNGQYLPVPSGNGDNIKVTVTVVGEPGLKDLLEQTVNKIWTEQFDFSKVSTDADDKWLLMKGLTGDEGREFLKCCEVTFNCFIDLSQKGTVNPPSGKSRVEVLTTGDTDHSDSSDDDDVSSSEKDVTDHEKTPMREQSTRQTYSEWQGDMDYDVALQLAIQQSNEEHHGGQLYDESDSIPIQDRTAMRRHKSTLDRTGAHAKAFPLKQNAFAPTSHQPSNQPLHYQPQVWTKEHRGRKKYSKSNRKQHATSAIKFRHDKYGSTRQNETRSRIRHEPFANTNITVYAKDKSTCMNALKEMGKKMKQVLLFEIKFERVSSLSKESKSEIAKVIDEHKVLAIKEKEHYVLKGKQEKVLKTHGRILEILLKNQGTSTMSSRPANDKRGTVEYAKFVMQAEPTVPAYWKYYKAGETLKNIYVDVKHFLKRKDYEKVDIDPTSTTYKTIVRMVKETTNKAVIGKGKDATGLDPNMYSKLWVTNIQCVENFGLFKKFCHKRQEMFTQLVKQGRGAWPKVEEAQKTNGIVTSKHVSGKMASDLHPEINEVLLFHGTKLDTIDTICQGGWDNRLASSDAMFGPGVYGAEMATKADQYTDEQSSRTYGKGNQKQIFLMRMLLGHCFVCTNPDPHKYRRAPCCTCKRDDCKEHSQNYDSVVGDNKKLFREFVVYEKDQCYPEYLITYERR